MLPRSDADMVTCQVMTRSNAHSHRPESAAKTTAYLLAFIWRASPDVSFNGVQFANTIDSFSGKRGGMRLLNIEELTANVSPACGFLHAAIGVQRVDPCIRIGLQRTFELCQMLVRMLARAVRC